MAGLGSALFLVVAYGVVAGLVGWLLTGWRFSHPQAFLVALGADLVASAPVRC